MKTKLENLVVINKEELEKRLKDIEDQYFKIKYKDGSDAEYLDGARTYLKEMLQSSKPLKPFVEGAFDNSGEFHIKLYDSTDYLSYDYERDKYNYLNKEIEW